MARDRQAVTSYRARLMPPPGRTALLVGARRRWASADPSRRCGGRGQPDRGAPQGGRPGSRRCSASRCSRRRTRPASPATTPSRTPPAPRAPSIRRRARTRPAGGDARRRATTGARGIAAAVLDGPSLASADPAHRRRATSPRQPSMPSTRCGRRAPARRRAQAFEIGDAREPDGLRDAASSGEGPFELAAAIDALQRRRRRASLAERRDRRRPTSRASPCRPRPGRRSRATRCCSRPATRFPRRPGARSQARASRHLRARSARGDLREGGARAAGGWESHPDRRPDTGRERDRLRALLRRLLRLGRSGPRPRPRDRELGPPARRGGGSAAVGERHLRRRCC